VPRKPVDKVVEHRISFSQKERDMIETLATAYTINRVANPVVNLLGDPIALGALGIGILALFPKLTESLPDNWETITDGMTQTEAYSWLKDNTSGGAAYGGAIGTIFGLIFGGPIGAGIGGVAGGVVGETTENFVEDIFQNPDNQKASSIQLSILSIILSAKRRVGLGNDGAI